MKYNQLFPTPVGFFDLEQALTQEEIDFLLNLPQKNNIGNLSSKDNYLFKHPELNRLHNFCLECTNTFLQEIYQPRTEVVLRITQAWANYTQAGQYHHKHAHPNSFVSGVFYVKANAEKDRIYFYRRDSYHPIRLYPGNWNTFNSDSWWFESIPNQLILFPSWMEHMVEATEQESETRISIAFNTFPTGKLGDNMELTELLL